jgi:hypothetical protein
MGARHWRIMDGMNAHEQQIEARINALFRRWPALCGFTVQHASGFFVGDVTVNPLARLPPPGALIDEIAAALAELLDECPEARELLRERTFARVFH